MASRDAVIAEIPRLRRRAKHVDYLADERLPDIPCRPQQLDGLELRDLDRALAQLPVGHREILLLVAIEGLSYKEVAAALGIPQGTVMSRLSRARAALRAILAGDAVPVLRVVKS